MGGHRRKRDTLEEPIVNRPFYSFGALLAALVLAIVAVSSSSRSTSVQPADVRAATPRPARDEVARRALVPHQGNIFVVVLPADENSAELPGPVAVSSATHVPSYATGCGLDRSTGRIYAFATDDRMGWGFEDDCRQSWSPCMPRPDVECPSTPIATAQVEFAAHDAVELAAKSDCSCYLTHYDAAYDRAVYGEFAGRGAFAREAWLRLNLRINPLALSEAIIRAKQFAATWLSSQRATSPTIEWSEYGPMLDRAIEHQAESKREAESPTAVRSSRWLMRFAASSLERASEMLQTMADVLANAAANDETEHLASEKDSSPR
jgi:hypothetical protein